MKKQSKCRLPVGVVEKLTKNPGGGAHRSRKDYNRKRENELARKQARELE